MNKLLTEQQKDECTVNQRFINLYLTDAVLEKSWGTFHEAQNNRDPGRNGQTIRIRRNIYGNFEVETWETF